MLFDEGHTLAAADRIASLEDELSASDDRLRATAADLDRRTDERDAAERALETARDRIAALEAGAPADPGHAP